MPATFSTAQKLSLAGMFIGGVVCIIGLFAPYWLVTDINVSGKRAPDEIISANLGVYMQCITLLGSSSCELFPRPQGVKYIVVSCGLACAFIGGICGLVALCLACCGRGSRFIGLGVVCFIAAAVGAVAPILFSKTMNLYTIDIMGIKVFSFGWAFYLFCVGVGVFGVVSIMACFSAPENLIGGMVLGHSQAGPQVVVAQSAQSSFQVPPGPWSTPNPQQQPPGPWSTPNPQQQPPGPWSTPNPQQQPPGPWSTPNPQQQPPGPWSTPNPQQQAHGPWSTPMPLVEATSYPGEWKKPSSGPIVADGPV